MDFQTILFSVLSLVLTALATWAVERLTAWLNSKIKDKQALGYLADAVKVVQTVVKEVYQTYVENLKNTNAFTAEAQKTALNKAIEKAKIIMSTETREYIEKNYGDFTVWITSQIESVLYDLKNKVKEDNTNENA